MDNRFNITNTKGKYPLHGNQSSFLKKLKKVFKSKELKEEIQLIKDIIRKNKPGYSEEEILQLAKEISKSGCTYVAAASNIMEQINYNEDMFYQIFNFPMRNSNGLLNHDALIAELYSFVKDKAEFDLSGSYQTKYYNSNIEAAKNILGKNFESNDEAFKALFDAGYTVDGKSYTKFISNPELIIEDYHFIAHKLLGQNINVNSIEELKTKLKEKGLTVRVNDYLNSYKFSGLNVKTFDKWMNYYFKEKNIELEFSSESIYSDSYDDLIEKIREKMEEGASISIGSKYNLSMTDGSRFGWFNFSSIGPVGGHAMPFVGVSDKGDFILTSWGELQMVPKEFYDRMEFSARKLNTRKIKKESNAVVDDTDTFDIYNSINKKIAYIMEKIQVIPPSQKEAAIKHNYKLMFTEEEKEIISLQELISQIESTYDMNYSDGIKR